MKETTNLKLKKPDLNDFYNVDDFNYNSDIIDRSIKEVQDTAESKAPKDHTHDASDINGISTNAKGTSFDNSTNGMAATNVQDAIEENKTSILELEKTDGKLANLQTTNKTNLVAAINEVFQNANNGKNIIANAIGSPLVNSDTFSAMGTKIDALTQTFQNTLTEKGIEVLPNDKMSTLINKVGGINTIPFHIKQVVGKINGLPTVATSTFGNAICVGEKIYRFYRNVLYIYNCLNDTYEEEQISVDVTATAQIHEFYDGNIYITGDRKLYVYNIETKTISNKINPHRYYHYMRSTMIDENIYIVGGYLTGSTNTMSKYTHIYNCITDTWSSGTNYPTPHAYGVTNNYNNFIYIYGGHNDSNGTNICRKYDIELKTWTEIRKMNSSEHEISGFKYKNKQYIFGGYISSGIGKKDVRVYNYDEDTWEVGTGVTGTVRSPMCVPFKNNAFLFPNNTGSEQIIYSILEK